MILDLVYWPNPILRQKSTPVEDVQYVQALVRDMMDTMEHYRGVGLSAVQIGTPLQVVLILDQVVSQVPTVWINPKIIARSDQKELMSEGCLSIPGIYENVMRHTWVQLRGMDETGVVRERHLVGQAAQCAQHELEHLVGRMFPDKLDPGAKDRLRAQLRKMRGGL